jgi:hypothetical protein
VPCYRAWGLHVCKNAATRKNVETPGAAFYKESRMKFVDPLSLTGNPGGWGTRGFVALSAEDKK